MNTINIGIIGAGENTRLKHIPELQKIKGINIASVCNRSEKSSLKVAREFAIKRVANNWQDIIEDEDIDAVVIGTWPNMHEIISTAALMAGKHVLCEARMAMNSAEAAEMLRVSRCFPQLVSQLVPGPFTFPFDETIIDLLKKEKLGQLFSINIRFNSSSFISKSKEMTWRENIDLSGLNTMMMGIVYESISRWLGHASSVKASGKVFSSTKVWDDTLKAIEIPEHLDIIADLHCGAQANMQFSSITGLAKNHQDIWIFGSEGTIHLDLSTNTLSFGKRDGELAKIKLIKSKYSEWRVEEEFISAIRCVEPVKYTTFEDGFRYMEFTEAVAISRRSGQTVNLPLSLNVNG
ncbi:MAG: Gfo/Idh/MocA family oxidoreductase [Lentisphaeraceae bacterium]|nr:Gfo/Idh/MocA family oxidoreductase [Lentisphaeraceae bacterium]